VEFLESNRRSMSETRRDAFSKLLREFAARYHSEQEITRTIANPAELHQLWTLDSLAYGQYQMPYEQLLERWQAYPNGITTLFHQTEIQGSIEIWPLSATVAQRFCDGQISEREIAADQMLPFVHEPCANWYLSGMMLRTMQRRTQAIKALITGTWSIFVPNSHFQFPLTILALGYSREGICFLRRFGFHKLNSELTTPDRCPLYAIRIDSWEDGVRFMRSRCLLGGAQIKRRPTLTTTSR
jgi:hypothetical protein